MPNLRGKTWTTTTPANVEDAQYWEDHLISDTAALKAASSVQSVNSITPDAQGNVDVVALPAGGTAGQVLTKQSSTTLFTIALNSSNEITFLISTIYLILNFLINNKSLSDTDSITEVFL